jgi:hypothetical protein
MMTITSQTRYQQWHALRLEVIRAHVLTPSRAVSAPGGLFRLPLQPKRLRHLREHWSAAMRSSKPGPSARPGIAKRIFLYTWS